MSRKLGNFVSKLPRSYTQRVLNRLLPPADEIAGMDAPQIAAVKKYKEQIESVIKVDPLRFFKPNKGGQTNFLTCWDHDEEERNCPDDDRS